MPYTDLASLTDRYGQRLLVDLTDRAEVATGQVDAAVVARAIADATALIDGYLAAKYVLPLDPVPALIADLAGTIAIYKLHVYEPEGKIKADYEAAVRSLDAIARGVIRIPAATGIEPATTGGSGAVVTDRERPFTEQTLKGFI